MQPYPAGVPIAADLLPWWFAAAFWLAFAALVAVVVRDVHRMGGPNRILEELRRRRGRGDEDEREVNRDEG